MHSKAPDDWDTARKKLIGLGDTSMKKSYYPELQERIEELNNIIAQLEQTQNDLKKKVEEMERFSRLAVGRELRIIELKNEILFLKNELNKKNSAA